MKLISYGLFRAALNASRAYKNLQNFEYGFVPNRRTVFRWFAEFRKGELRFEDRMRSGRIPTRTTGLNILRVKRCVDEENRRTIPTIARLTGLKNFTVWKILKFKLKMKKYRSVYVPQKLSPAQKLARKIWCEKMIEKCKKNVNGYFDRIQTEDESYLFFESVYLGNQKRWLYPNQDYPKQVRFNKLTYKKRMFFLCFNRRKMVLVSFHPFKSSANADNYIEQLEKIVLNSTLDPREVIIHHDNAPIHRSYIVQSFLNNNKIEQTGHPAYSPDLAPNDFWLIRKVKKELRDGISRTEDELLRKVIEITNSIPESEFRKCFDCWIGRMEKCIAVDGDYFEYKKRKVRSK